MMFLFASLATLSLIFPDARYQTANTGNSALAVSKITSDDEVPNVAPGSVDTHPNTYGQVNGSSKTTHHTEKLANGSAKGEGVEILANQGKTATFMLAWPSITTFTLVKGWNNNSTKRLRRAVKTVVRRNPILTGRATYSGFLNTKISIKTGAYPIHSHDFVQEIVAVDEWHSSSSLPLMEIVHSDLDGFEQMSEMQILQFMDEYISPMIQPAESVIESCQSGGSLFAIDVVQLPDNYACYYVRMSHCVGDGVTYYNIMNEIDQELRREEDVSSNIANHHHRRPVPLVWDDPKIASHEIFPERFSQCDVQKAYGVPFFLGLLRNAWHIKRQRKEYLILCRDKIEKKRHDLLSQSSSISGHLSANDIITSALCQANKSSSMFAFTMNMRDRHDHLGGNFHNEIPFLKKAASAKPFAFRNIIKNGYYFESGHLPTLPFLFGQVGRISSISSVQKLIHCNESMEVLCHSMLSSFVQNVPLDVAFVTLMNDDSYVVLHNFREIDKRHPSLKDIEH